MHYLLRLIAVWGVPVLLSVTGLSSPVSYAAPAPVFDADNLPASFGNAREQDPGVVTHDLLPSPQNTASSDATTSSTDGGFVPAQSTQHAEASHHDDEATEVVDSLQGEVQTLRNQVEQLSHQLQQVQSEQKTLSVDVEKQRLAQQADQAQPVQQAAAQPEADAHPSQATASPLPVKNDADTNKKVSSKAAAQPNNQEEQKLYETAYNLIKKKKYNEAVETFQDMLKQYPSGHFASNAHYWLGELFGLMGKNDLALNEFNTVITTFPKSARVSDAELKVGLIYSAQSNWQDARLAFEKVLHDFPNTTSAHVAAEQLRQIKQA